MTAPFTEYLSRVQEAFAAGNATEHTHRPALKALVEALDPSVVAVNEPKRMQCGSPDFVVTRGRIPVGAIEAKDVGTSLDEAETGEQVRRYLYALPNVIFTDGPLPRFKTSYAY